MSFFVYLFLFFAAEMEVEMCTPAFPLIEKVFNLNESQTEWIFGVNVLFHCVASLFAGVMGDKYGKKKILFYGFLVLFIGSIITAVADSYAILLIGRALQGVGLSGPAIVIYPMFLESQENNKNKLKSIGYFNAVFNVAVGIAPTIGSYATVAWGWRGSFYIILLTSLMGVLITKFVLKYKDIINTNVQLDYKEYLSILKSKKVMLAIVFNSMSVYILFTTMIPLIFIGDYGISQKDFGLYSGAAAVSWGFGSVFLGYLTNLLGRKRFMHYSLAILCLGVFLIAIPVFANKLSTALLITVFFSIINLGFIFPSNAFYLYALDEMPEAKSRIGTILMIIRWSSSVFATQLASHFYTHSFRSTGVIIVIMLIIELFIAFWLLKLDGRKIYR
jgi:DHA1 family bicyclomycin/chloramphenicol resistance-like MFS transporter